MSFSAGNARRKWPCECSADRPATVVTVAAVLLALVGLSSPAWARKPHLGGRNGPGGQERPEMRDNVTASKVPLPRPRPVEAPGGAPEKPADEPPADADRAAEPAVPAIPEPSACRRALSEEVAIAPSIPDIHAPGGCGGEDLVRLEAIVLADRRRVAVTPAATLRCTMALAIADWVRTDVAPLATGLGSPLSALDNFDSYECRGRNRVAGAQLSEHGRANALDVRGLKLADGRSIGLTDRTVPRELRETVLHSVCSRFATVLGPGSDWYHEDHIHLDLMERRNNYRICQWNVWDPLPQVAPLLPAERPEEAPPRETASGGDEASPGSGSKSKPEINPDAAGEPESQPDAAAAGNPARPSGAKPPSNQPATKKRRSNRRS